MLLGDLFKLANKKYRKILIKGISFDSRRVKKGDIFFAIKGNKTSGIKFINEAIINGAVAVASDQRIKNISCKVPILFIKDARKCLAETCSKFYKKKPSNLVAVTGTNGKSSVVDFFYQIMTINKVSAASIGTLGIFSKKYNKKTNLTSLDPLTMHKNLEILSKNKVKNVIMEASSHGLKQKRLDNLNIKVGIFTNLSHDHIDYHKNIKAYLNAKMHLFKKLLKKNSKIVTDEDNKEFSTIKNIADRKKIKKFTIGSNSGNIKILDNQYKDNKQIVKISSNSKIIFLEIPLVGYFQIKNLLMAVLAASCCGLSLNKILNQLEKIKPVPGRLECIGNLKNNSKILIDFAHTPDALEQSLVAIKRQFKKKIIIVFGCGGERDKKKRTIMGKIAKKYCRKIFITDDNPRNENPQKIRKSIMKGCKKIAIDIGSRKKAIELGIEELKPNEVLLVAGKGHEKTQDYGNKVINFSDKKVIKEIINKKNSSNKKFKYKDFILQKALNKKNIKNVNYNGVSINTKTIKKNNLFFAIKGKKIDGHKFTKEAIKKGATKSVISKGINKFPKNKIIRVSNTFSSLNNLAKVTRDNTSARIIGITGSVGKTTLKNLISFALKNYGKVYYSPHSYNNKFGVPLSVSNLKEDTKYGVFEVGMDKKGEIDNLSKIVKPHIAVITNISGAHFKNFNSLKDIAKAKAEIINNISPDGKIILNKDDNFFNFLSKKAIKRGIKVVSFSSKKKADISLSNISSVKNGYRLKVKIKKDIFYFDAKYPIDNLIKNILACIAVLYSLNLNLEYMKKKFINFTIPSGRGDIKVINLFNKKFRFIDESYNANPLSMHSAINNMNHYERKNNTKKIIFLGDMLELGIKSKQFHKKLCNIINKSDIDKVYVYGNYIKTTFKYLSKNKRGKIFNNLKEAYVYLSRIINNNDLLMVKGSNATGLNQFSKNIKKRSFSVI